MFAKKCVQECSQHFIHNSKKKKKKKNQKQPRCPLTENWKKQIDAFIQKTGQQ